MRTRPLIVLAVLGATVAMPSMAEAQLSPGRLFGGVVGQFRHLLGRFGHYRHIHRSRPRVTARPSASPKTAKSAVEPNTNPTPNDYKTGPAPTDTAFGPVGPAAWPNAYTDIVGFTFMPDDYASQVHGHGFDVIADAIMGRSGVPRPAPTTTGTAVRDRTGNPCQNVAASPDDWPTARIEAITQLSDQQRQSLGKLQTAVLSSVTAIRSACPERSAATAPQRLHALVSTLWAVRDGGIQVRAPVHDFYGALSQEQQSRFAGPKPPAAAAPSPGSQNPAASKAFQDCAAQNIEPAERMVKELEATVRPNQHQRARIEKLHKISSNMAKLLTATCAQPVAADPPARLDAADAKLAAMNYAALTVQIAFNDFYAGLDDAQKARLDGARR
jgi:hypothetical protein